MNDLKTGSSDWAKNNCRNTLLLGYWTGAWLVTMALATFGPVFIWHSNNLVTVLAIIINIAVGFGMILANRRHLRGSDEMHQKIQLEAMALALGIGIVVGLAYSTLDTSNVITWDAEISHLVILLGITYFLAVIHGVRKYR